MSGNLNYLDSSVVLATLLDHFEISKTLEGSTNVASSRLMWTEVARGIQRAAQSNRLQPSSAAEAQRAFARLAIGIGTVQLSDEVLRRAEGPYPLPIRTLDAIHLASAEQWLFATSENKSFNVLSIWSLDRRMNECAALMGFSTPLL